MNDLKVFWERVRESLERRFEDSRRRKSFVAVTRGVSRIQCDRNVLALFFYYLSYYHSPSIPLYSPQHQL